jgi:hypothetical protein
MPSRVHSRGKMLTLAVFVAASCTNPPSAHAQECRSIKEPTARLKCYDTRDAQPPPASAMSLVDFKTDRKELIGKTVEVEGVLTPFVEGIALLGTQIGDLHPVSIDVTKLPRDQRRSVLSCPSACKAKVRGKAGTVSIGQIGIVATEISMLQ